MNIHGKWPKIFKQWCCFLACFVSNVFVQSQKTKIGFSFTGHQNSGTSHYIRYLDLPQSFMCPTNLRRMSLCIHIKYNERDAIFSIRIRTAVYLIICFIESVEIRREKMSYILCLSHSLYYWILKQLELFRAGTFSYSYSGSCWFHVMII